MATATRTLACISPEEFLERPDRERHELFDGEGELVEMTVSSFEGPAIAGRLITRWQHFGDARAAGMVMTGEATCQSYSDDPNRIRRPDVGFIRKGSLFPEQLDHVHWAIPPDVDVDSSNDILIDVERENQEYLAAGVEPVWTIRPQSRSAAVHRLRGKGERFEGDAVVLGESVHPDFEVRVSELFPHKSAVL
jgi:Uma2 family endonuclease